MSEIVIDVPYISLAKLIHAAEPRKVLINELLALLRVELKKLGIVWNPKAFRAALGNSDLPEELLERLEDFLRVADELDWRLPKTLLEGLDKTVEDIEAFNPAFLKSLEASRASGRVAAAKAKARLGL